MTTVTDLQARLKKVDVSFEAESAIEATKKDIIDRQQGQLVRGIRADGKPIGKYKSPAYAKKKHEMNPIPGFGNMDWILTGSLKSEIFVDVRPDIFVIDSADPKTARLIDNFGDPFGLTKKNQKEYVEGVLRTNFMSRMRKAIGV